MFGKKCPKCNSKVKKGYDFCPHCGTNFISDSREIDDKNYGFLGKKDEDNFENAFGEMHLPFAFRAMLKPLLKELDKQMNEMNKQVRQPKNELGNKVPFKSISSSMPLASFSVYISGPGQKPVKISAMTNRKEIISGNGSKKTVSVGNTENLISGLPKFDFSLQDKIKKLPKKEPETSVRRLSDKIVYELDMPGVKSMKNININQVENGFEIKSFSDKEVFVKKLVLGLPLLGYSFKEGKFSLELGLDR